MAKENRTRFAVLGMLHYADMTGYEIRKRLNEMVGYFWQEANASVYPALKSLEEDGCVTGSRELPSSGPARVRYSLTSTGREAFAAWLQLEPAPAVMRNEFALKMLFGNLSDESTILSFIREELQTARTVETSLSAMVESLPQDNKALMWRLIADYGRAIARTTSEWCEQARAEIEKSGWTD